MSEHETGKFEPEHQRTVAEVVQEIREEYENALRNQNAASDVIREAISTLESCRSWPEFAQRQNINRLRIQPGTHSEKLMILVQEYYSRRQEEE